MQPKIIATSLYKYHEAEWDGTNGAGFIPTDDKIIVLCDTAPERTAGGIDLTPDVVEKQALAAESGVIIAIADGAFVWTGDRTRPYQGRKPVVGDRIRMQRYSGQHYLGADGRVYRIMEDRNVGAIEMTNTEKREDRVRALKAREKVT